MPVFILILVWWLAAPAHADGLDDVRASGRLVWGADQEGGGPYVWPDDANPDAVIGFEVDIAARLAKYLGVRAEFFQGPWDRMPELLRTAKCDIVLNGYEWSPERADVMEASIPYYVYGLQLLVRAGEADITGWDGLVGARGGAPVRIGVLTGSAAETFLLERFPTGVEVVGYDGNTDAMREVETGKLDATLQDTPIASFYAPRFPGLEPIGPPVGAGYYVIYARKGETRLVRALNEAIVLMLRSGELERIERKYGIWDDAQRQLLAIAEAGRFYGLHGAVLTEVEPDEETPTEETIALGTRKRGLEIVTTYGGVLLQSAGLTVVLSLLSFPLAMALGLLVAVGRMFGPSWVATPLAAYVEFLRGTPVMLQLYFVFFFLPEIGIVVPAFWTAVLGLAVNYSAYESEIYRAGLQAVPRGQTEAALALGMTEGQALRRIVAPQAFRVVIPPMVNDFIALFKDTSVCSVVTLIELTKRFSVLSQSTQATMELMGLTALLYLMMSWPLSRLSRSLERRLTPEPAR